MGYYSEVGIVMPKTDFEELLYKVEKQETNKEKDAFACLTNADHYYIDKAKSWTTKKEIEVIGLHYCCIKANGIGMDLIFNYIGANNGAIAIVGEETGDVTMDYYDKNEDEIEWYDYLEPMSYVEMKLGKTQIENFNKFIKEAKVCY